jgi:hypothetical protein
MICKIIAPLPVPNGPGSAEVLPIQTNQCTFSSSVMFDETPATRLSRKEFGSSGSSAILGRRYRQCPLPFTGVDSGQRNIERHENAAYCAVAITVTERTRYSLPWSRSGAL